MPRQGVWTWRPVLFATSHALPDGRSTPFVWLTPQPPSNRHTYSAFLATPSRLVTQASGEWYCTGHVPHKLLNRHPWLALFEVLS